MDIVLKNTGEWSASEWDSFVRSFNQVFEKEFDTKHFIHKYSNTIDKTSYHSLLIDSDEVVGACAVIPYNYEINNRLVKIGLVVDVFIIEEKRTDPLALYRMYKKMRKHLIENGIQLIIAVPNDVAYPYWKNVVKWKDIGQLSYHVLPIRIANMSQKIPKQINWGSTLFAKILLMVSKTHNSEEIRPPIRIDRSNPIVEFQRYTSDHKQVTIKESFFSYRIVKEKGTFTCYLIDFYNINSKKKNSVSLREAIKYVLKKEKIDLIIYIGKLSFKQFLLFKLPKNLEPKHLYFTTDIFSTQDNYLEDLILNISNWDFGLFNYDVR